MNGFIITVLEQSTDYVDSYVYHVDGKPLLFDTRERVIIALPGIMQAVLSEYDNSEVWYSIQPTAICINSDVGNFSILLSVVSMNGETFDLYAELCELYGKDDV